MIAFLRDSKCCEYWIKGKNIEHCTKIEMTAVYVTRNVVKGKTVDEDTHLGQNIVTWWGVLS